MKIIILLILQGMLLTMEILAFRYNEPQIGVTLMVGVIILMAIMITRGK